jgi:hypothetical protein
MTTNYVSDADKTLRQVFEQTAERLSGKRVTLQFVRPLAANATGECFIDEKGIGHINIAPGQSVQDAYNVLMEEIAHLKLAHPAPMTSQAQYQLTQFVDSRQVNQQPTRKAEERQAERLADGWIEWAHGRLCKANKIRTGMSDVERAVLNCYELINRKW